MSPIKVVLSPMLALQNDSLATLLARLEGILGPIPDNMLQEGCYTHRYYTIRGDLYEQNEKTVSLLSLENLALSRIRISAFLAFYVTKR